MIYLPLFSIIFYKPAICLLYCILNKVCKYLLIIYKNAVVVKLNKFNIFVINMVLISYPNWLNKRESGVNPEQYPLL